MERTPSQTIGPFFHEALRWTDGDRVSFAAPGSAFVLAGRILDGAGEPVADAMIETWQRLPDGSPAAGSDGPHGFGRIETGRDGGYRLKTAIADAQAPYIDVTIFARGLLKPLRTRVHLAGADAARADPLLAPIAGSPRLATLVATPAGAAGLRWDIRLQGEGETVFFAA